MTDFHCPICRGKNGTHKMDCQNASYMRRVIEQELANVERIAPKRIEFDLDENSAAMVFVEHNGEDVLSMLPGGHLTSFGEAITPGQLSAVLRIYLEERFKG